MTGFFSFQHGRLVGKNNSYANKTLQAVIKMNTNALKITWA